MDNSVIWKIIDKYFEGNPQSLVRHHVESYNDFMKNGIFRIFKEKNPVVLKTRFDESIDDYRSQCHMYMGGKDGSRVYFGKPVIYDENDNVHYMYPNEARLRNMTYGMTIHYDIEIEFFTILEEGERPILLGGQGKEIYAPDEADDQHISFENYKEKPNTEDALNATEMAELVDDMAADKATTKGGEAR